MKKDEIVENPKPEIKSLSKKVYKQKKKQERFLKKEGLDVVIGGNQFPRSWRQLLMFFQKHKYKKKLFMLKILKQNKKIKIGEGLFVAAFIKKGN